MRPIDADALIPSEVHTIVVRKADGKEVWESVLYAEQIDNAPTIEAEPVKHGQWEYVRKRLARGGYVDARKCSICHKIIMPHLKPNYCPNCGAKMDEEVNENETN